MTPGADSRRPRAAKGIAALRVVPALRHYAWGDHRFIPALLGEPAGATPVAEAWYGAHPAAPATIFGAAGSQPLDRLIDADRRGWLGSDVADRFDALPYLLKLLAAARPLSIQVHPDAAQAQAGFAREEAAGIARDAPGRNYPDPRHKPELLVALTEFRALCGFRPLSAIREALAALPELAALLPPLHARPDALRTLLEAWFALDDAVLAPALAQLMARLAAEDARQPFPSDAPAYWALLAHRERAAAAPPDRGLLMVFLLELLTLRPGQGMFLAAGVPHAYLQGAGVELMANSDNVLRAGLTAKHVDAAELLRIVRFDGPGAQVLDPLPDEAAEGAPALRPEGLEGLEGLEGPEAHGDARAGAQADGATGTDAVVTPGEHCWPTEVDEFLLSRLQLRGGVPLTRRARGPETLLALPEAGHVSVDVNGERLLLGSGAACLIPAGARYSVAGDDALVFRVRVPGAQASGPGSATAPGSPQPGAGA